MSRNADLRRSRVIGAIVLSTFAVALASAEEPFNYFVNDWNLVGLTDYRFGTRLSPNHKLLMGQHEWRTHEKCATVQIRFGRDLKLTSRRQTRTCIENWIPVFQFTARDGDVQYDFTIFATPLPSVKDWKKAYDWPTEGEDYLTWIWVKINNHGDSPAPARLKLEQAWSDWSRKQWPNHHPVPSLAEPIEFEWPHLEAGADTHAVVRLSWFHGKNTSAFDKEDPRLWMDRTIEYWRDKLGGGAQVEVPCKKATQAMKASHVCQLLAADGNDGLHAGEGPYDGFYIRDGGYQMMQLEEADLMRPVKRTLEIYLRHQRGDGHFDSQGQFDANGQAQWVLWQYYKISGDREFLARAYPAMRRAADWTSRTRRQNPADSPFAGVLTSHSFDDGENYLDSGRHIVGYDFWNLRGMLCTADAARILGKANEAAELHKEAGQYHQAIEAAWKRLGVAHFPPAWEKKDLDLTKNPGTHWGNTETLWPTELFTPDDPRVSALIKEVRQRHGGGFTEGTIHWTGPGNYDLEMIHQYLSTYTTMASLIRGEHEQVVEDFYWFLLHSTPSNAFAEGILYQKRTASSDVNPHVTAAAMCALMLRHMILHERGEQLHLLSAVPDWWLGEGQQIRVAGAPTHFGKLNLTVRGTSQGVELDFDPPKREPPKRIVLYLPQSRPLLNPPKGVEIIVRPDQKKRWDFPTVVRLYEKDAVPFSKLIEAESAGGP